MTLIMFKMIIELKVDLNELKWSLNERLSTIMSLISLNKLNGLKRDWRSQMNLMSSNFNSFTNYAYQCKTWHMLQFLKRRNKPLWPIFIGVLGYALWRPLIYAPNLASNVRPHKVLQPKFVSWRQQFWFSF